ncbi:MULTISPECIES: GMP synthase [unclassified Legionella]|uniref:glutamine amidotransferase-related protein n=1 Tax=unclassified Legionella TaxID=2622702 RepID=UPI001054997C|nr:MULTISPECIES: GMP synthase [unclassified Legionella]MDI9818033.1 GMP synthase [Legionella sp. PL877]
MNIGILLCDHLGEQFSTEHGQYPDMFASLLHQADPGLTFSVYHALENKLPNHIDAAEAYLITGSRHGVNEGFPWISNLEAFILELHMAQKKMLGICFGHQLIAKALGGKVVMAAKGWGVGMSINKITGKKPWMTPEQEELNLLVSHREQVVELPLGAEVLASSDFCPFYMMQIGNHFLTIQGHPEFSKAYSQALIEDRRNILGKEVSEQGLMSLELKADDGLFAKWMVNFLRNHRATI